MQTNTTTSDTAVAVVLDADHEPDEALEQDLELADEFDDEDPCYEEDDEGPPHGRRSKVDLQARSDKLHEDREARSARIAADLPDDEGQLIAIAGETLRAYDQAVRTDEPSAAEAAVARYEAVVWKLNGATFFGCLASDTAPGARVANGTAAAPGQAPIWGQKGEWLVDLSGMRVLVRSDGGLGSMSHHYTFHVVDVATPFISETGFWSHFGRPIAKHSVEEAVAVWIQACLAEKKKRVFVQPRYRDSCADSLAKCAWLQASGAAQSQPTYKEASGQMAFAF